MQRKLRESGIEMKFSSQEIAYIERLGGRASDLESVSCSSSSLSSDFLAVS